MQSTDEKSDYLQQLRHSAAHVLAAAVVRLFPTAKYDIGPSIDNGFYYDFDLTHTLTTGDLEAIEAEMKRIVAANEPFERIEVSREEAEEQFQRLAQPYKLERLADIPKDETVSLYRNGNFLDLCRGPHVKSTNCIKAVKLLSVAGCYYRGSEKNKQLQRIYGTAFESEEALRTYLNQLEFAKKHDHRTLGVQLNLFYIDDLVGQGLILWTPKGTILRQRLQAFLTEELDRQGYVQVITPHIGKLDLFRTSGHYPYYKDSQFAPIWNREDWNALLSETQSCEILKQQLDNRENIEGFLLKPMNCPMHVRLFASQPHSYRDLPVRMAEFGTVYRWEQSGELGGLTRVRGFTQDDAHIFCTEEQLADELTGCLKLINIIFNTLGMSDYRVRISLRDPNSDKYIGDDLLWTKAEEGLRKAAQQLSKPATEAVGEAAFYGPKLDFIVRDVIGREWQLGTIQIDYNLPQRFKITYVGKDNQAHVPIMIHRAPFGSMERFCGLLIEHFAGDFPLWLSPEQVRILPINDSLISYADGIHARLKKLNIRCSVDDKSETLGAKIRKAEMEKVPYVFIVGEKEKEAGSVAVRSRCQPKHEGTHTLESVLQLLQSEIEERTLPQKMQQR
ncbi:MAG: threonine--tRNA ligase [Puniceicoccales bacterium]|jgi:threonyl-tRNA synthetase|nr:threonine--tRNA ligase [Puniceicoccales bacterium]